MAYATQEGFPFNLLTDRQFECLLQDLARSLKFKGDEQFGKFDSAILMQGVGERGRDCALVRNGKHVGAIQCKRYQGRVSKPDAAREIIKFCLHAMLDKDLAPDPSDFKYVFASSSGFTEPANLLLAGFADLISKEGELLNWTREVASEFKAFEKTDLSKIQSDLLSILEAIDVYPISFNELNTLLADQAEIIQKYFSVRMVVDHAQVASLSEKLDGLTRTLGDDDTRRLLDSLNAVPKDQRADFGLFSIWGYPEEFLKNLASGDQLRTVGRALIEAKGQLDQVYLDHLKQRAEEEVLAVLASPPHFSTITRSAAAPYVAGQMLMRWSANQQGNTIIRIMGSNAFRSDARSVRQQVLQLGEAYLANDWSMVVGDAELLALKKLIIADIYRSFASLKEMEDTFDREWPLLEARLNPLLARLETEVPTSTTVVVGNMKWFDNFDRVKEVFSKANSLGTKKPKL